MQAVLRRAGTTEGLQAHQRSHCTPKTYTLALEKDEAAVALASAVTRGRGDGGAVHTLKRYLRPYEEEGSGAVLLEREPDGTVAPPPRHNCPKPAKLDTDVWHWTSEIDSDGCPEDGHGSLVQGVFVECEARSAGSGSGPQLAIPRHLAAQQSSACDVLRDRPLIAAPPSSEQITAAPTNRASGKIARLTNFYLEPRYRRHAQHMALHDLPLATSATVPSRSSTSSSIFLQLFTASPPSCPAGCEVKRDAASRTNDDEMGVRPPIWSIIMKYYAAHHERQLPPHAPL
ncbi:hypothetical protein CGC21_0510 [Leishmania donovani]|uniref:Uncharacterized protein n=1 Tax=Leishmania donovani TaxID=5661 RepID=A0A504XNU2_LEIDO|nr:hypothetical protein CGC21_0510 [Leishmania donovani]